MNSAAAPARRNIIVIGASAGGVEALLGALDTQQLDACVLVVLHLGSSQTALPEILTRRTRMRARLGTDGEPVEPGQILVAPPDHHMLVSDGVVRLSRGPRENRSRPAIDPLFRTAAAVHGPRVIGLVLSGVLDDGSAGLAAVRAHGGLAIVQDPEDATFAQMPRSAIARAGADHIVPLSEICPLLTQLIQEEVPAVSTDDAADVVEGSVSDVQAQATSGDLTGLTCPECGGALWESNRGGVPSFRCRVGHAYAPESLEASQVETVETALWAATRALEEQAALFRRSADRLSPSSRAAAHMMERADEAMHQAGAVRSLINRSPRREAG